MKSVLRFLKLIFIAWVLYVFLNFFIMINMPRLVNVSWLSRLMQPVGRTENPLRSLFYTDKPEDIGRIMGLYSPKSKIPEDLPDGVKEQLKRLESPAIPERSNAAFDLAESIGEEGLNSKELAEYLIDRLKVERQPYQAAI